MGTRNRKGVQQNEKSQGRNLRSRAKQQPTPPLKSKATVHMLQQAKRPDIPTLLQHAAVCQPVSDLNLDTNMSLFWSRIDRAVKQISEFCEPRQTLELGGSNCLIHARRAPSAVQSSLHPRLQAFLKKGAVYSLQRCCKEEDSTDSATLRAKIIAPLRSLAVRMAIQTYGHPVPEVQGSACHPLSALTPHATRLM